MKALSRQALSFWSEHATATTGDLFAADYRNHQEPDAGSGVSVKNLEEWTELVRRFHSGFSEVDLKILTQLAEGDQAASHWSMTATHTGSFEGETPTNRRITWTGISLDRFEQGKIAETWVDWDKFRFLESLGMVTQTAPSKD
ncbi:MAG: ester cyclase [Verrucomicrobiota bacterium]